MKGEIISHHHADAIGNTPGYRCGKNLSLAGNDCKSYIRMSQRYADNRIYHVGFKSHSYIYLLTRSEKWIERLIGFVAGVASTVLAELIVFLITA